MHNDTTYTSFQEVQGEKPLALKVSTFQTFVAKARTVRVVKEAEGEHGLL